MQLQNSQRIWSPGNAYFLCVLQAKESPPRDLTSWQEKQIELLAELAQAVDEEEAAQVEATLRVETLDVTMRIPWLPKSRDPQVMWNWAVTVIHVDLPSTEMWRMRADRALEKPRPVAPQTLREAARALTVPTYLMERIL